MSLRSGCFIRTTELKAIPSSEFWLLNSFVSFTGKVDYP